MCEPETVQIIFKSQEGEDDCQPQLKIQTTKNIATENYPADNYKITGQILPPEVWKLIFEYVESPKDLLSCWYTTSFWTKLLRSTDFYFKMAMPFLIRYLNRSDILRCSAVSRSWNAAVDATIQYLEDFGSNSRLHPVRQRVTLNINSLNMTRFLNTFTLTKSKGQYSREKILVVNPVAFRHVNVWLTSCLETQFIFESKNLLKCLEHHGHLIRHLHLWLAHEVSQLDKIKLVKNCLERTPNLRVLKITIPTYARSDVEKRGTAKQLQAFNDFISHNPWPPLNHLKVLKFGYLTFKRSLFIPIVNTYGPSLHLLKLGFGLVTPIQLSPGRFSSLQKLVCSCDEKWDGVQLGAFVTSNKCPLKHLTVAFRGVHPNSKDCEGLTLAANSASATLETLHMYFKWCQKFNFGLMRFEQMRLPRLKELNLGNFSYPALQSLQSVCPALQTLIVTPQFFDETNKILKINRGDMYANLYSQHQFWNRLADIQSVDVNYLEYREILSEHLDGYQLNPYVARKVFTRIEYKDHMKRHGAM